MSQVAALWDDRAGTRAAPRVLAGEDDDLKVTGVPHVAQMIASLCGCVFFSPQVSTSWSSNDVATI